VSTAAEDIARHRAAAERLIRTHRLHPARAAEHVLEELWAALDALAARIDEDAPPARE
jgi:hypothetical protein